jgi:hypothetical protein
MKVLFALFTLALSGICLLILIAVPIATWRAVWAVQAVLPIEWQRAGAPVAWLVFLVVLGRYLGSFVVELAKILGKES